MEGLVCPVPLSWLLSAQRMKTNDWSTFTPSLSEGSEGSDSSRPGKTSPQPNSSLTGTQPDALLPGAPDGCRMFANVEPPCGAMRPWDRGRGVGGESWSTRSRGGGSAVLGRSGGASCPWSHLQPTVRVLWESNRQLPQHCLRHLNSCSDIPLPLSTTCLSGPHTPHPPPSPPHSIFIVSATISSNTAVASNPIRPLIRPQWFNSALRPGARGILLPFLSP